VNTERRRLPGILPVSRDTSMGFPWGTGDLAVVFNFPGSNRPVVVECVKVERRQSECDTWNYVYSLQIWRKGEG